MSPPALLDRLKRARIVRVLAFYLGASWAVLQVVDVLEGALSLPEWVAPVSVILLLVGLVIIVATAMVQAPGGADRAEDSPGGSDLSPGEIEARVGEVVPIPVPGWATSLFTWRGALLGGAAAFVVLIVAAILVPGMPGPSFGPAEAAAEGAGVGVAVLPFTVNGDDMEVWREGMVDVLAGNLDGAGGLRSIDPRTVMSRWRSAVGGGEDPELGAMLEIARSAGARYAVVGSAVRIGDEVRLNTQVYDVVGGRDVGSAQAAGPNADVLSLVDRLSVQTAAEVLASGGGTLDRLRHTTSLTTNSPDALRAYLEGEALYRGADFAGAADAFRRAVAMDSTFALAAVRLSRSLGWLRSIGDEEAGEALELARRFRDRLPPREREHLALESIIESGSQRSVAAGRQATQNYPDDPEFWEGYGEALWHQGSEAGYSMADAGAAFDRALDLDPGFGPLYIHPMELAVSSGDTQRAAELLAAWEPLADAGEFRMRSSLMALQIGDETAVAEAMAYLPQIGDRDLVTSYVYAYSRRADHAEADRAIALEFRRRGQGGAGDMLLFSARLTVGAVDDALDIAFSPVQVSEGRLGVLLASAVVPGAVASLPGTASLPDPGECQNLDCWFLGAVSITRDDAARHEAYVRRYEGLLDSLAAAGAAGERIEEETAYLDILRTFAAWRAGDLDDGAALARFRAVHDLRAPASGYWALRHSAIRWWMAEALLRQERYDEARRYFDSLWDGPWGAYFILKDVGLGDAYRGMGDEAAAREAYEQFLRNWSEAPTDNPMIVRARAGLDSLGS